MAWIISILLFVIGCIKGNDIFIITSGLYAIAGCISGSINILKSFVDKLADAIKKELSKPKSNEE